MGDMATAAQHDGQSHQADSHGSPDQVGQSFVGQREERCVFLNISISEKILRSVAGFGGGAGLGLWRCFG